MKIKGFASLLLPLVVEALLVKAQFEIVDLIDQNGLEYFKANNISNTGTAKSIQDNIKSLAKTAVNNQQSYSVINTTQIPPNGNKHEYYSWAPYFWPDCSGISQPSDSMHQCPYVRKDGQYVSDLNNISDPNDSAKMVNDVTVLGLSYFLYGGENYAQKASQLLQVWFLNNDTAMLPDLTYSQVVRGPGNWTGRAEGVLDMRYYAYLPAALNLMQNSSYINSGVMSGVKTWFTQYIDWLQNSQLGQGASSATNNHGTYYVVQTATYSNFIGKPDVAIKVINNFLQNQFQKQISADGDQPLESQRTRPYHYQCFNLAALTYIARLSQKINGPNVWTTQTASKATIKTAIDYIVSKGPPSDGDAIDCLVPIYAARDYYGDSDGKYKSFLDQILKKPQVNHLTFELWNPTALNLVSTGSASSSSSSSKSSDGEKLSQRGLFLISFLCLLNQFLF